MTAEINHNCNAAHIPCARALIFTKHFRLASLNTVARCAVIIFHILAGRTGKKDRRGSERLVARKKTRPRLTKQNELGSYLISAAALARVETGGRRRNEIPMCSSKKVCGGGERWKRRRAGKRGHMGYQYLLYSSQLFFSSSFISLLSFFRL